MPLQPAISPDGKYAFLFARINTNAVDTNASAVGTPVIVTDLGSGKVSGAVQQASCCPRPNTQASTSVGFRQRFWHRSIVWPELQHSYVRQHRAPACASCAHFICACTARHITQTLTLQLCWWVST